MIFVTGGIAPWPDWDRFYRNNTDGTACVRISRLIPSGATGQVPLIPPVCSTEIITKKQSALR
jgi:hypothetical protein